MNASYKKANRSLFARLRRPLGQRKLWSVGPVKRPWTVEFERQLNAKVAIRNTILKYRWLLMLLFALAYLALELIEHGGSHHGFSFLFLFEFWIYVVFFPLIGGFTLTLFAHTERERELAIGNLDLKHKLSVQLSAIQNWDDLCEYLIQFPRSVAPFNEVSLFLYDQTLGEFLLAKEWQDVGETAPVCAAPPVALDAASLVRNGSLQSLSAELCPDLKLTGECVAYGLPLMHGKLLVALYLLKAPPHARLLDEKIELLNSVAPSIALAVDALHPFGSRLAQAEAAVAEQRRLSRYLHDTIAQDFAFLILKLEQLQDEEILPVNGDFRQDLVQLHQVANQAYLQARDTIAALNPYEDSDLATVLYRQAKLEPDGLGDLKVELMSTGQPRPLSAYKKRKIAGIVREALANTRKHAQATEFDITLLWGDDCLTLTMSDDGKGFGLEQTHVDGHYGIRIMQERAREVEGELRIDACPENGTDVILRVPIKAVSPSRLPEMR